MKKTLKKTLSIILVIAMMISFVSVTASAIADVQDSQMLSALNSAKSFIDSQTVNSSANVPSTVVSKFGTQFSWDNEKRETANKSYLFEWSYYNGVVFEGIEDIYDYTKNSTYRNYAESYMSTMISSNGTWAKCTSGNTSKDAAGYVDYHGADCYKTASLLIDMAKDANGNVNTSSKYYKMATTLYNDLTTGTGSSYAKSELGYNYWHSNWNSSTAPTYKVWLDGIYMIQPFMAEYAYYSNDTAQMNKIFSRFQWLYNNDRNSTTGLYYHALNSKTDYCNYHWTRGIGWYAMAVVDVMQYMSGTQLDTMKVILKDLVDNMLPYQDASTGMWANLTDKSVTSTNRLETSGTAMMAYTIAKGVNNGWLDDSYGVYAKAAFKGMVSNKLSGTTLSDIYFKASANGSDNYQTTSYYYSNEGKGFGPFIMAYAQVLELYENSLKTPEPEIRDITDNSTGITVEGTKASAMSVNDVTSTVKSSGVFGSRDCVAYDINLTNYTQGDSVTVSIPVPQNFSVASVKVYYLPENGEPQLISHNYSNGKASFVTNHMSVYALAATPSAENEDPDYPVFPHEGSVKIDKWATGEELKNTGIGEVSLTATAVPPFYSSSVDVLFVTDVSNSMYWTAGTTTFATETGAISKLKNMQDAVAEFSSVLLADNIEGNLDNNTISFVTFGGLDKQHEQNTSNVKNWSYYADPTRTLFTSYDNYNAVTSAVNNIRYEADSSNNVYITFDGSNGAASTTSDLSYGGTNYDYGFMEASSAIEQIKANYKAKTGKNYETSNRGIYVIFVTDGAPTHYNGTMYRYDSDTTRPDKNETWINSSGNEVVYTGGSNNSNYTQANWYNYIKNTDSYWATKVYNTSGVKNMSALGIDLDNGGFNSWVFTDASGYPLKNFVESIVENQTLDVYLADDSAEIASGLLEMADQIAV
ncbi:MAG: glycoside hydrolase family 88 protein [Clostridia bacterium]|nr:glycoside hydrolase family 88 protein [Clostridia bacterium]